MIMTSELQPRLHEVFRRMVGVLVAVPLFFMVVYPWLYIALPENLQSIADLPQDFQLVLLAGLLTAPPFLLGWYAIERRKRWTVSDRGVEMFQNGVLLRTVSWDSVVELKVEAGSVALRTGDARGVKRLRFVGKTEAAQAVRMYRCGRDG